MIFPSFWSSATFCRFMRASRPSAPRWVISPDLTFAESTLGSIVPSGLLAMSSDASLRFSRWAAFRAASALDLMPMNTAGSIVPSNRLMRSGALMGLVEMAVSAWACAAIDGNRAENFFASAGDMAWFSTMPCTALFASSIWPWWAA